MEAARPLRSDFRFAMADLEDQILTLGRRVQQMVGVAADSLQHPSNQAYQTLRAADDRIDLEAYALDARLYELLTLQSPVADDLRLLLSLQKVLTSVERIGDGCLNISRLGRALPTTGVHPQLVDQMHELGLRAQRAVETGLDLFSQRRTASDRLELVESQIDQLHEGLTGRLIDHASGGRAQTEWAIQMVLSSRHFERIGDHAVKISREGIFVATGVRVPPRPLRR